MYIFPVVNFKQNRAILRDFNSLLITSISLRHTIFTSCLFSFLQEILSNIIRQAETPISFQKMTFQLIR